MEGCDWSIQRFKRPRKEKSLLLSMSLPDGVDPGPVPGGSGALERAVRGPGALKGLADDAYLAKMAICVSGGGPL